MQHPAIERSWTPRMVERFLNKYGPGLPDTKPQAMQDKLWRVHAMSGFRVFGPGYACYTTFPIMVCEWSRYYDVVGEPGERKVVVRVAANSDSRFWKPK